MATCLDIITSALKLARALRSGGTPTAAETADGMACLQSFYDGLRTGGMFGELQDEYVTADQDAQEGRRYLLASGVTLTEPSLITDTTDDYSGCDYQMTVDDRQPRDLAFYESLTSTGAQSARLYDRTGWVDLLDLDDSDEAPLSSRGQMGLAACLATSGAFCAMFGDTASMNPGVRRLARDFTASLMQKLGSTQDRSTGTYM